MGLNRRYLIPISGGIAYLVNPKAATSSIKVAMTKLRDGSNPYESVYKKNAIDSRHTVHVWDARKHLFFHDYYPANTSNFPLPPDIFRFTFVRHPVERFISFYNSKIKYAQDIQYYFGKFGIKPGDSLERTVDIITNVDYEELEEHAMPQNIILRSPKDGKYLVDYIGRIEDNINDCWNKISNLVGFRTSLGSENVSKSNLEGVPKHIKSKLEEYYFEDMILFGYDSSNSFSYGSIPSKQFDKNVLLEQKIILTMMRQYMNEVEIKKIKTKGLINKEENGNIGSSKLSNTINMNKINDNDILKKCKYKEFGITFIIVYESDYILNNILNKICNIDNEMPFELIIFDATTDNKSFSISLDYSHRYFIRTIKINNNKVADNKHDMCIKYARYRYSLFITSNSMIISNLIQVIKNEINCLRNKVNSEIEIEGIGRLINSS